MKNILLVEDDAQITNLLSLHLHEPFYRVTACDRGATALEKIAGEAKRTGEAKLTDGVKLSSETFHLIILDIMLPDLSGIEICRRIRAVDGRTPILILSSLSEETDKVTALELGADDYLTKPFGIFELMARVKALLRRQGDVGAAEAAVTSGDVGVTAGTAGDAGMGSTTASGDAGGGASSAGGTGLPEAGRLTASAASKVRPGSIYFKDLVIDRDKHKVTVRGQRLELTPKEFDLLWLLASYPGKTFSRHELLELIWGFAFQEYEHTVTSHINRLRIKLEKNLNKPEYILTTWGTGYRFAE
jgi:DNA-binding response OmpR family regulator